jgi:hypothetical protein
VPEPSQLLDARPVSGDASTDGKREARSYRECLCGAGQGCRGRILERLYMDHGLPLTVELFHQLAIFILSCKPISYCHFKRVDVYIL